MSLLSRLERRFGRFAIPNLTAILIAGQAVLYFANMFRAVGGGPDVTLQTRLIMPLVLNGQIWRLVTFVFTPPTTNVIVFALLGWLVFYMFGSNLERLWGEFRFNMFLAIAWLANIAAGFIGWYAWGTFEPNLPPAVALGQGATAANVLLYGSVFLAFARLFPDVILNLFFVLPIKVKWLAIAAWIAYAYSFVRYDWPQRFFIAASLLNYALYFGRDHWREFRHIRRRRAFQSTAKKSTKAPRHECRVCGQNSDDSPRTAFRYCSKCEGQACYCPDHIRNHEHVTAHTSATP